MKRCGTCGASIDDNVTFCTNCGANQAYTPANYQQPAKESISVGGWIGRSLIPLIPVVGGIVYLIMLFIWSGDTNKEDTFRNWAKAQLIVTLVVVILSIILIAIFGLSIADIAINVN
jgi:uncharacterized membrane protein YvbJ